MKHPILSSVRCLVVLLAVAGLACGSSAPTTGHDAGSRADGAPADGLLPDGSVPDAAAGDGSVPDGGPGPDAGTDGGAGGAQIIADHTIVARYDAIPSAYLDQVKTQWLNLMGESHSRGYRIGLQLLADADSRFPVSVTESGPPEPYRTDALRISGARRTSANSWSYSTGEDSWYTSAAGQAGLEAHLSYCEGNSLHVAAMGFGWCWDMTWHNSPGGEVDPVFKVHWAGSSVGGPEGDLRWGLDAADTALTGNSISMDTYLSVTQAYADYCATNSIDTKVLFTTGPVDGYAGESGYQRHLKHEHLRQFVAADTTRILFDYADILAWSDAGDENLQTWTDGEGGTHSYQMIHADNMLDLDGSYDEDGDHIGARGALRLGKAMWWLLARTAGWDGQ